MVAQTWNLDLSYQMGQALGKEMKSMGVTTLLAPGMNIHRNPLGGRNFEYYSEDPLISGIAAVNNTRGIQSNQGIGVAIKHFALR